MGDGLKRFYGWRGHMIMTFQNIKSTKNTYTRDKPLNLSVKDKKKIFLFGSK